MPASLHILAPGLTSSLPGVERLSPPLSQPLLERFLSRADLEEASGSDLESTLCQLFAIDRGRSGDFPLAALRRGQRDGRFWLQAEPVCLRPDQSRLLLFDTRDFEVSAAELHSLAAIFTSHFEDEGWIVDADDPFCWYISLNQAAAISSNGLGDVFGRNMDLFLPQGAERLRWHRILNETQMLFFGAEVNVQREASGKMPIGGLWFSGFGYLPERIFSQFQHVFGNDALTTGLATLSATPLDSVRECRGDLLQNSGTSLAVYPYLQRPVWRVDTFDWVEKVAEFSIWLEQRWVDLQRGRLKELLLYPCDGRVFRLTGRNSHRFWRGSKPLSNWLRSGN